MGFKSGSRPRATGRPAGEREGAFYLRLRLADRAGSLAKVSKLLADAEISVNSLLQDEGHDGESDLVVITHATRTRRLHDLLPRLKEAAGMGYPVVVYPVLDDVGC